MPNLKKTDLVSSLLNTIKESPNFVVFLFDKTSHRKLEDLRNKVREVEKSAKIKVIKNSLFKVVANKINKEQLAGVDFSKGASALLTLPKDWSGVLSEFFKFAKADGTLSFKVGVIDDVFYSKNDLNKLAQLPSKEQLIAKILSSIKAPVSKFTVAAKFNQMRLINILKNKSN
jgi:large subunit ribosomal protein L10